MQQMSAVECGAACVAMILGYYGHHTSMEEIRDRTGVGRDGLSALDLVQAARSYGLRVRAIALQEPDLRDVALPAIRHLLGALARAVLALRTAGAGYRGGAGHRAAVVLRGLAGTRPS